MTLGKFFMREPAIQNDQHAILYETVFAIAQLWFSKTKDDRPKRNHAHQQ